MVMFNSVSSRRYQRCGVQKAFRVTPNYVAHCWPHECVGGIRVKASQELFGLDESSGREFLAAYNLILRAESHQLSSQQGT